MKLLYNFLAEALPRFISLIAPFNLRLKKLIDGRKNLFEELTQFVNEEQKPKAWFHVASLGEYEQSVPLINGFKSMYTDFLVVVSFFSTSGYDNVKKKKVQLADFITYIPFDNPTAARKFLDLLNPAVVFFIKYDIWPNHVFEAKRKEIPIYLVSARLNASQIYFKSYGKFFKNALTSYNHIFCQNKATIRLLQGINYQNLTLTGDTRYDRVFDISKNPIHFRKLNTIYSGKKVLIAGSVWPEDMDILIPFINQDTKFYWIIAPHDIDRKQIEKWQKSINKSSTKYSELSEVPVEVLFIDNIGMLSSLYQFANLAYVGGAMGHGLHNILEPLAFGIPVVFGKLRKPDKFPESHVSQEYGCGFEVENSEDFTKLILGFEDKNAYQDACNSAKRLLADNLGSCKKILEKISVKSD